MNRRKGSVLNQLLKNWPPGAVATSSWLEKQGVSRQLLAQYKKSGWLDTIGGGAVARADYPASWQGGMYAIQKQLRRKVHVGGKTALERKGYGHFLKMRTTALESVWLFGKPGEKLPKWFLQYHWGIKIYFTTGNLFISKKEIGLEEYPAGLLPILIASPERAILETLSFVPRQQSYEESKLLMEGLAALRPALVQRLLESCASIKVKRLFMSLAEALNHPWFKKLNQKKINFGKGKRELIKGGKLDPKYLITIPRTALENP